jgi:hypothetical protein
METAGTFVTYVVKNKELLIHTSDFISFLLVTPEISKFMSVGLAKRWKYVGALFLSICPCLAIPASVYLFLQGKTALGLLFVGVIVFYAIVLPGMLRELWNLLTEESVPIVQRSLRKGMFTLGFFLFGFSRAVGILASALETH